MCCFLGQITPPLRASLHSGRAKMTMWKTSRRLKMYCKFKCAGSRDGILLVMSRDQTQTMVAQTIAQTITLKTYFSRFGIFMVFLGIFLSRRWCWNCHFFCTCQHMFDDSFTSTRPIRKQIRNIEKMKCMFKKQIKILQKLTKSPKSNISCNETRITWNNSVHLNRFKPEFTIVIVVHYKPRIVVAILDL